MLVVTDMEEQVIGVSDELFRRLSFSTEDEEQSEVIRQFRHARPVHYLFKIENFSLLSRAKSEKYESSDFDVSGYKWKLSVYPKGNKKVNENNKHISLYLVLSKSNAFNFHKEVNVYFKLFVYNQILDKYLSVQDSQGRVCRFRGTKTEYGFDQLVPLDFFNDPSNGYLIDDCCIFGAEIFVLEPIGKGECVSFVKELVNNNTYTWNVRNFSALTQENCKSPVFNIGSYRWTLSLYPKGSYNEKGRNLSLFLHKEECFSHGHKLYVEFVMRVKDQVAGKHQEKTTSYNQFHSNSVSWGVPDLIPLSKLNDASEGYLVNGGIILEVEISLMTLTKEFS